MTKKIQKCRISGSTNLISVLSLGDQALTGVFPRSRETKVTVGPLELVWCLIPAYSNSLIATKLMKCMARITVIDPV